MVPHKFSALALLTIILVSLGCEQSPFSTDTEDLFNILDLSKTTDLAPQPCLIDLATKSDLSPISSSILILKSTDLSPQSFEDWKNAQCVFGNYSEGCNMGGTKCIQLTNGPIVKSCPLIATNTFDLPNRALTSRMSFKLPVWTSFNSLKYLVHIVVTFGAEVLLDDSFSVPSTINNSWWTYEHDLTSVTSHTKKPYNVRLFIDMTLPPGGIVNFGDSVIVQPLGNTLTQ